MTEMIDALVIDACQFPATVSQACGKLEFFESVKVPVREVAHCIYCFGSIQTSAI